MGRKDDTMKKKQKDVADAIGVTVSAYSNYEQGIREPSYSVLILLCKFFNVSSDYLLGIDDDQLENK